MLKELLINDVKKRVSKVEQGRDGFTAVYVDNNSARHFLPSDWFNNDADNRKLFTSGTTYEKVNDSYVNKTPHNFKGCFLFNSEALNQLHLENTFSDVKSKVFTDSFTYAVVHGMNEYTLNTAVIGQHVPAMRTITLLEFNQLSKIEV